MSNHQELHRQSAAGLRDVACVFLNRAEKVDNRELKRKLARRAYALVQEAAVLEPFAERADLHYTRVFLKSGRGTIPIRRWSLLSGRTAQL